MTRILVVILTSPQTPLSLSLQPTYLELGEVPHLGNPPDSGIVSEPPAYSRRFVRVAVTPVPATDDYVSDLYPSITTLLGSVLGGVGVDPDDGGGPSNDGMFARAALLGSDPIPNWERRICLGYQEYLKLLHCYPRLQFPIRHCSCAGGRLRYGSSVQNPSRRINTTPPTWPYGIHIFCGEILRRIPHG